MKTIVIYHSADFDGIFCREIARKFLPPDTEFIGWNFGDIPIDRDKLLTFDRIYVMDLPVEKPLGLSERTLGETQNEKIRRERIIWIDHHKTAIETHPADIPGYRIDGVAACRLAWQWFVRESDGGKDSFGTSYNLPQKKHFIDRVVGEPLAVRLAGEYDIWDKRDPDAELFQHGLKAQELTEAMWEEMLADNTFVTKGVLQNGRTLQYAREKEYAQVIKEQGFDIQFEGLCFLACNSHELDIRSHLFAAGIKDYHQALFGFTYLGSGRWRVSLYHAPGHEDIDLSVIAKKHGGGGHRGACGFTWAPGTGPLRDLVGAGLATPPQ